MPDGRNGSELRQGDGEVVLGKQVPGERSEQGCGVAVGDPCDPTGCLKPCAGVEDCDDRYCLFGIVRGSCGGATRLSPGQKGRCSAKR